MAYSIKNLFTYPDFLQNETASNDVSNTEDVQMEWMTYFYNTS